MTNTDFQYGSLREKIRAEKKARTERYAGFETLYQQAHEAGIANAKATTPTPMIVTQHANPLDDNSPATKRWWVDQGACGFAWIKIFPATSSFAKWLVKTGKCKGRSYGGGIDIWVSDFGQSVELKSAYADGFARVLKNAGITAYSQSRLD